MPAAVFNPLAAVIVHAQVPVNPETFQMLDAETSLLIHQCTRTGRREPWKRYNKDGKLIAFVRHSPVLTYAVAATALDPMGENLGNYHPGRCLSDRALAFINGRRTPYQFEAVVGGTIPGKFILHDPTQEPGAGDTTEVTFTIEHAFIDIDTSTYPGGGTVTPAEPTEFVEIPAQTAAQISAAGVNAILADAWQGADSFDGEPLTLTLYNGTPGSGGVALGDPIDLTAWTDLTETTPGTTRARNHAILTFLTASLTDRTLTHLLWRRNSITIAAHALATPLTIPAYYGVRVPIAALALTLQWPYTGAGTYPAATMALRHLLGHTTGILNPSENTLTIRCYDGDPDAAGVLLDTFTAPRNSTVWTLPAAGNIQHPADITGTDLAPGGGWVTAYISVELNGADELLYANLLSGTISTAVGDPIVIPAGTIDLTVS